MNDDHQPITLAAVEIMVVFSIGFRIVGHPWRNEVVFADAGVNQPAPRSRNE